MSDDLDELSRRLDRIEQLLRRQLEATPRTSVGPEVRSARSIVSRIDDVWVAVTEGNERVVSTVELLRTDLAGLAVTLAAAAVDSGPAAEEAAAARAGGVVASTGGDDDGGATASHDPAPVHLRLNRIEEALAGIAERLEGVAASVTAHDPPPSPDGANTAAGPPGPPSPDLLAMFEDLGAEISRLGQRVDSLALALEASVTSADDDTLARRLGRLRDQFRR